MTKDIEDLIKRAEAHVNREESYEVAEFARDDVPELCSALEKQDEQIESLQATLDLMCHDTADIRNEDETLEQFVKRAADVLRTVRLGESPDAKSLCLCPVTSEYEPPCPRHGVLGIGVTGR